MAHAAVSGLAAATAAVLAKVSLSSDSPLHTSLSLCCTSSFNLSSTLCSHVVRGASVASFVLLNCLMVSSFVAGLKDKGSVAGTATSFAVNFGAR